MIGVVVCGGESRRMGDDKGLLASGAKTWAQIAKEKIATNNIPVVLSINEKQGKNYQLIFSQEELIVDVPERELAGPLLGVLSVHRSFPNEDLLVLACDMLHMEPFLLKDLVEHHGRQQHEAVAFIHNNMVEPLCAIYTARGLTKILALHQNKSLTRNSLKHVLETLNTDFIVADERWSPYFRNFNSPDDVHR